MANSTEHAFTGCGPAAIMGVCLFCVPTTPSLPCAEASAMCPS